MTNEKYDELKSELEIKPYDLETELINQPQIYDEVCEKYAEAVAIRDYKKDCLNKVESELYDEYAEQLKEEGERVTEKAVSVRVSQDKKYRKAQKSLREAKLEVDKWGALKESFYQRSHMLRDLVNIFVTNFRMDSEVKNVEFSQKDYKKNRADKIREKRKQESQSKRDNNGQ